MNDDERLATGMILLVFALPVLFFALVALKYLMGGL